MKDFFVSYHSGDLDWVRNLVNDLEARGVSAWRDGEQLRPGDRFVEALGKGLNSVRSVVVVVSNGSAHSKWVREECDLALTLGLHVTCVLIDDTKPWGFLEGRSYVDFTDSSKRAANLDALLFGITGERRDSPGERAPRPPSLDEPEPSTSTAIDEVEFLIRQIGNVEGDLQKFRRLRLRSFLAGLTVPALFWLVARETSALGLAAVLVGAPLVTGLIGWGLTAVQHSQCQRERKKLLLFRDGLQLCLKRSNPRCMTLRNRFWDDVLTQAGVTNQPQTDA